MEVLLNSLFQSMYNISPLYFIGEGESHSCGSISVPLYGEIYGDLSNQKESSHSSIRNSYYNRPPINRSLQGNALIFSPTLRSCQGEATGLWMTCHEKMISWYIAGVMLSITARQNNCWQLPAGINAPWAIFDVPFTSFTGMCHDVLPQP